MSIFPKKYNKESFINFLENDNISGDIIMKFVKLPEHIFHRNNKFELYIESTRYCDNHMQYKFELNYYSDNLVEYLFNSKVYGNVEMCINNLTCELINSKFINKDCKNEALYNI